MILVSVYIANYAIDLKLEFNFWQEKDVTKIGIFMVYITLYNMKINHIYVSCKHISYIIVLFKKLYTEAVIDK